MKFLSGSDIAAYVKERQARQVRALTQSHGVMPSLVIIRTKDDPVISTYIRLKQDYGKDIGVEVENRFVGQTEAVAAIELCNQDPSVHGIIVQLPLEEPSRTDSVVNAIAPGKDVDGLGEGDLFVPATAMAIDWLLGGYNISLQAKRIVIIGMGRLVGQPLLRLWQGAGYDVSGFDKNAGDATNELKRADIIVTATGVPGSLQSSMIPIGAVVVDAGTASESGKIVGDVAPEAYERHDLTITPPVGGVGPLTVAALFDNVIRASQER